MVVVMQRVHGNNWGVAVYHSSVDILDDMRVDIEFGSHRGNSVSVCVYAPEGTVLTIDQTNDAWAELELQEDEDGKE